MYLLKMEYCTDGVEYSTIDICYSSDIDVFLKFIEQLGQYIQYKKKNLVLPEWLINSKEIREIIKNLGPLQLKLYNMKQLNLPSLNDNIIEYENIISQLRLKLDTLNEEQQNYIKLKQKEISSNKFPTYIQNFYKKHIKQKHIYKPILKIVEVDSFETLLGKLN